MYIIVINYEGHGSQKYFVKQKISLNESCMYRIVLLYYKKILKYIL